MICDKFLPLKVVSSNWNGTWVIFQNETSRTQNENFKVALPVNISDVEVEGFFVLQGHLLK